MKLHGINEFNKFETSSMTQLNKSKVRGLK